MRYWWPVNFAELASLQKKALERLSAEHPGLLPGSIVTIASIAKASKTLPKVAVPLIDRLFIEDPDTLWQLAHSLALRDDDASKSAETWRRLLADLIPAAQYDPDGAPVAIKGLKDLICEIHRFKRFHPNPDIEEAAAALSSLLDVNTAYASDALTNDPSHQQHQEWRAKCQPLISRITAAVNRRLRTGAN
jgi:hypothetical protein